MNIGNRTGLLTLPLGAIVNINISIDAYSPIMCIDPSYLTPRIVLETSNTELVTPTTILLSDPLLVGRYTLLSSNVLPHTEIAYMVYYDSKYNDIVVIPTLELYTIMTYLNNASINIIGHAINFSGTEGGTVPMPNVGYDIRSTLASLVKYNNRGVRGAHYRKTLTPNLTYSGGGIAPIPLVNFGPPATMFATTNFITDINLFSYESLHEIQLKYVGKQQLQNVGVLVAQLPL